MSPLPEGDDLPRPCELEAIIEEEAELGGPLTSRMESKLMSIWGIADGLLASGELAEDAVAYKEVRKIASKAQQYTKSYHRRGGGRAASQ
jgi:hypothetical protein